MSKIAANLVKDGNSMAIRIPKTAIRMSGISGAVELSVSKNKIVITNAKQPRHGWAAAVQADKPYKDNELELWETISGETLDD